MLILGINGHIATEVEDATQHLRGHDAAAVLLRDGEILAAIEEERLNRVKHANFFPRRAIRECLALHGFGLADVDYIALNVDERSASMEAIARFLEDARCVDRDGRALYAGLFEREFGAPVADRLRFCNHHLAHAWSAYGPSGEADSLVVVFDGEGDFRSGGVYSAHEGRMELLREFGTRDSLGHFYTSIIRLLGYNEFDEYKAMGLAPYGDPAVHAPLFRRLYSLLPEGRYELADRATRARLLGEAGLIDRARRKGEPFTRDHKDVAAALQQALEAVIEHVLRHFRSATGHRSLCLAGGVAHNCSANGKVLQWGLFDRVFVQPAAHDAGGALGAAWHVLHEEQVRAGRACAAVGTARPRHAFLGRDIGCDSQVAAALRPWEGLVQVARCDDVVGTAAALLAEGRVLGWVQGRSEFGPRALGHRSILADPRPASNKQRINAMVKQREAYRPFAPSVPRERLAHYFELPSTEADLSFMTYVLKVREPVRATLGAVTHVDGTARVQAVSRDSNELYWHLIEAFGEITGVHVLLNTSFNNHAEPIVDSVDDALTCFLTTGLDAVVIGNHLVTRRPLAEDLAAHACLVPRLPPSRKLVRAQRLDSTGQAEAAYRIDGTMNRFFARTSIDISVDAWRVLQEADGRRTLGELMREADIAPGARRPALLAELHMLWCERFVMLRPTSRQEPQPS